MSIRSDFIEGLLFADEDASLDFKREQYAFERADKESKSELLKDVLAFVNAFRRADAYILIGVEELIHPLILLSNDTKDSLEYPLLHKHLQKPLHQWTDSLIRPVGNMVIQHQPLTKQRVRTIFHRVRL